MRQFSLLVLLFGNVFRCIAQGPQSPPTAQITVHDYAESALFYSRSSGSVVLRGKCVQGTFGSRISTDELKFQAPDINENRDDSLIRLNHSYPNVTWSRAGDGVIRVRDSRASAAILDLHIGRFELINAVSLTDAIKKLTKAPEVQNFLSHTHTQLFEEASSSTISDYDRDRKLSLSPSAPKYSRIMTDVTLEEALDSVIRVFPGIWIYQECPGWVTVTAVANGTPNWKLLQPATGAAAVQ